LKKIGILDSGIGGVTILNELLLQKLDAEFYYISDTDNVPYGGKTQEFMLSRTKLMINGLLLMGVDSIVIACNTLTAQTIELLRDIYTVPFVGIEPYINYLNNNNTLEKDNFALILTEATYNSQRFTSLRNKRDPDHKIKIYPLKKLALLIEKLSICNFDDIKEKINIEIAPLLNQGHTHLILGCTHYPIIGKYLEKKLNLKVLDPHNNVVKRIIDLTKISSTNTMNQQFYYDANLSGNWQQLYLTDLSFLSL
jgi:glutamate racemase